MAKRLFDIFFSAIGLVVCAPIFLVAAVAVAVSSPGGVLFTQERVGMGLLPFRMYKFRSMVGVGASGVTGGDVTDGKAGPLVTAGGDERVTRVGRWLRRAKVDELPQLWNVLKGDMSLVGPRPEVPKFVAFYRDDFAEVLRVRPGITDAASVAYIDEEELLGGRDDPEAYYVSEILPEKIKMAKLYAERSSILYDFKIIIVTLGRVFRP